MANYGLHSQYNTNSKDNPLHKFATYNVLFTLSGCTEKMLNDPKVLFNQPLQDVIARSSGIGPVGFTSGVRGEELDRILNLDRFIRGKEKQAFDDTQNDYAGSVNILRRNHDVFFEDVNILSTAGPNGERNLANFTKMEFKLHEPYSITFIEKVRACAYLNGYLDYQAAPFLLTIQWVGTDENGKQVAVGDALTRKVPINIVRVDFDVNEGGAVYDVVAVPYPDMAFDDIYKFPRSSIKVNTKSLKGWIDDVKEGIAKDMVDEIKLRKRQYADRYFFKVHPDLEKLKNQTIDKDEGIFQSTTVDVANNQIVGPEDDLLAQDRTQVEALSKDGTLEPDVSIVKMLEDIVRSIPKFQDIVDDFWGTYLTKAGYTLNNDATTRKDEIKDILTNPSRQEELVNTFINNQYVDWFKIKPAVVNRRELGLDVITKMYAKDIYYNILPYKIHVLKLIGPGLSLGKVDWSRLVRRNYNYIYTGDNVDIQNLRINYKTAYYMRNVRPKAESETQEGLVGAVRKAGSIIFGRERDPDPVFPLRTYPSVIKGRNLMGGIVPKSTRAQEFFDYLVNPTADMVNVDLEILGDPAYIAQDQFSPNDLNDITKVAGDEDKDYNGRFDCFNMDSFMPIVNLTYRMPADIQENKGVMFEGDKLDENLFFSGLYQVARIDSRFEQGQFTQTLKLVRFNNQQGAGTAPKVIADAVLDQTRDITAPEKKKSGLSKDDYEVLDQVGDPTDIGA